MSPTPLEYPYMQNATYFSCPGFISLIIYVRHRTLQTSNRQICIFCVIFRAKIVDIYIIVKELLSDVSGKYSYTFRYTFSYIFGLLHLTGVPANQDLGHYGTGPPW